MSFPDLLAEAQKYFPQLQIKYKNTSWFMNILGKMVFFNKYFMTTYITTIGSNIYVPNANYFKLHPVSGPIVFMHELVHLYDQKRMGKLWFYLSYFIPQLLIIPSLLLFLISWKIALILTILFLLPTPSYFRMNLEKRAYLSSIYTLYKLSQTLNFDPHLDTQNADFVQHFTNGTYYWMWPFKKSIINDFSVATQLVQNGNRPYQDPVFDMLDDLITKM